MVIRFVFIMAILGSLIISLAVYPLVLGGCILLIRLAIVGIITFKFRVFYGLVLLLIFVGGLLVAFGYAVALASNPFFGVSNRVREKSRIFLVFCSLGFLTLLYFSFYYFEFEVGLDFGAMVNFFQRELSLYVGFE